MSKVVTFQTKDLRQKANDALRVLEDAYAYYTPEEPAVTAASDSDPRSALEQMYQYYAA